MPHSSPERCAIRLDAELYARDAIEAGISAFSAFISISFRADDNVVCFNGPVNEHLVFEFLNYVLMASIERRLSACP
jgi:hypothetical protein